MQHIMQSMKINTNNYATMSIFNEVHTYAQYYLIDFCHTYSGNQIQ